MPSATETESEACPVMHGSVMLSSGFIKPHRPPYCRSVKKAVAPTGQDLVDIALMAYIIDDAVARGVKLAFKCDSQLYNAQIGRQMTAGLRHRVHDELAQRRTQHAECVVRQSRKSAGLLILFKIPYRFA